MCCAASPHSTSEALYDQAERPSYQIRLTLALWWGSEGSKAAQGTQTIRDQAQRVSAAPGRLGLQQHVVRAVQRQEARAGDQRGQAQAFVEGHACVAARMHHQRGHLGVSEVPDFMLHDRKAGEEGDAEGAAELARAIAAAEVMGAATVLRSRLPSSPAGRAVRVVGTGRSAPAQATRGPDLAQPLAESRSAAHKPPDPAADSPVRRFAPTLVQSAAPAGT